MVDQAQMQTADTVGAGAPGRVATWRLEPQGVVFFSSACIMVVELVAGRLIARYLGSSLYTWTSIIGLVLAGMSAGNYVGGRLADRLCPRRMLGWLFLLASISCMTALAANELFASRQWLSPMPWVARIFVSVLAVFLPPALVLGTISPAAAKMALERSKAVGSTIGSVYAWGALGSIVGTFATGYWLIAALGSRGVMLAVVIALALVGLALGPKRWVHVAWCTLLAVVLLFAFGRNERVRVVGRWLGITEPQEHVFAADSNYQFVRVETGDSDRVRVLCLDYLIHGYVDLDDPENLQYDYERIYRDVAVTALGSRDCASALFLGGGSYTFPRWVLANWPDARVDVAEIDPAVVNANHVAMGLPRDTPIRTYVGDARNVIDDLPTSMKYDLIFGDAFHDLSVPFHLTTLEFNRKVAGLLTPDGAYLVNIIDNYRHGRFLGAYVLTLKRVFAHVEVFCSSDKSLSDETADRDTFVVVASKKPLDLSNWLGPEGCGAGFLMGPEHLQSLAGKCRWRILTDDDAPVDNLLAPVVAARRHAD